MSSSASFLSSPWLGGGVSVFMDSSLPDLSWWTR
jgi:hypothetical protein